MKEYRSDDWLDFAVDWQGPPYPVLESDEQERKAVNRALDALEGFGVISGTEYNEDLFAAYREAVLSTFEIPWTGIGRRIQRLLYALNAIERPETMVAAGVFVGNTFICNAGAAVGPGACYVAKKLVGIEIDPDRAAIASRNMDRFDPGGISEIVTGDAAAWIRAFSSPIDLLYIDADNSYDQVITAAAETCLESGSLVLAHNSVNLAGELRNYLAYVRDPSRSSVSVNVVIDDAGLEVTRWR
jgi:predicted O-methyltransferase YrrM